MPRRGPAIVAAVLLAAVPVLAACSGGDGAGAGNARGSDGADAAGGADRSPAADCDPARPATSTDGPQTFSFGGDERAYLLALPDAYDGTTAHPLVFSFHGFGSNKEGQDAYAGMAAERWAAGPWGSPRCTRRSHSTPMPTRATARPPRTSPPRAWRGTR